MSEHDHFKEELTFRGARGYFTVPAGIGVILLGLALICSILVVVDSGVFTKRTFSTNLSAPMLFGLVSGFLGIGAMKLANDSFVDRATINEKGVTLKKVIGPPLLYEWSTITKVYSDERGAYLVLSGHKNLDITPCLQDFEGFREALSSSFKKYGQPRQ